MPDDDLRRFAFALAYRLTGGVADAEDLVQEAMLRLHAAGDEVENPRAYVATVVTRLGIDHLRSAPRAARAAVGLVAA